MARASNPKSGTIARNRSTQRDPAPKRIDPEAEGPGQSTTPEKRWSMIQLAAYLRAERRGFQNGDPTQDWLDAEREVDAQLARGRPRPRASAD